MRILSVCLLLLSMIVEGQQKITLEDLQKNRVFVAKDITALVPLADGKYYATLNKARTVVEKREYGSGKAAGVLLDLDKVEESPVDRISGFEVSSDEQTILLYVNKRKIFRHSFSADYYVFDSRSRKVEALSEEGGQRAASLSPNGQMVAFVKENNICLKKLKFGTESLVTKDGALNKVINGVPDWVNEEEFGFVKAFEWSPDSREIAYVKYDETAVADFSIPDYGMVTRDELYPTEFSYKYPRSGMENSKVSVHVFNVANRTNKVMGTGQGEFYFPRVVWSKTPGELGVLRLNRRQNVLDLLMVNSGSGVANVVFTDKNEKYIDESALHNFSFLNDGKHFVALSEEDGFNHIYLYTLAGTRVKQITSGQWDVTKFYGADVNRGVLFYQSAEASPLKRDIYSIRMDGKSKVKLSQNPGMNHAFFNNDGTFFVKQFSDTMTPDVFSVCDQKGKVLRVLEDNKGVKKAVDNKQVLPKEFFQFESAQGHRLNGWMLKPEGFSEGEKYPVLLMQYSGPGSQKVLDQWGIGWEQYLAANGYLVVCVDGRGTGARGEAFKKCTYLRLGELEAADQVATANYLGGLDYVDAERIGIWGWSYGGFTTCVGMSRGDGIFKVGIAVAAVTSWRLYDSVYTERFMRQPQENPKGYSAFSPIDLVNDLEGRLFLIHGSADDNVHYQNMLEYSNALIGAGKQFDMFVYPNRKHSIVSGGARMHLYNMMSEYIFKNL